MTGLDAAAPAGEDVFDGLAHRSGCEDEEAVAGFDDRAAAGRDRVVAAPDDGDDRASRETELADGGAGDRVVGRDGEVDELELAQRADLERGSARAGRREEAEPPGDPLERRSLHDRGDDDDEEDGVEDRVALGTSEERTKVASTIGTAPRSPAQPSSSRSRALKSLKAVEAQTAAGRITTTSSSASARPASGDVGEFAWEDEQAEHDEQHDLREEGEPFVEATSCRR